MSNYKIDDDALKAAAKRGKPPVEIYRPGSGPLPPRKTGRGDDEVPDTILPQKEQRKFEGSGRGGERDKPRGPGGGGGGGGGPSSKNHLEVSNIVNALIKVQEGRRNNVESPHSAGEDTLKKNRNRKPESKLYVAKHSQSQQNLDSDNVHDKSVRNNNRVNNSFKEGNNRVQSDTTNSVDRNQSVKGKDRNRGGTVSDDENSNSQSLASGRNTSDRSKKVRNDRRKREKRRGGGGGGMRNDANRQMNGFQEHQPEKTSQPSSRGQESVASDNSHTYESSNSNFEHANNNINTDRSMRHASEPRVMSASHHYGHQQQPYDNTNRSTRDTHSMEHNDSGWTGYGGGDKAKPRDNRRHMGGKNHKTNHHSNTEIPPRFQKKKQMEMKQIGADDWDGSSMVIQASSSAAAMYSYPAPTHTVPPPPPPTHHPPLHHPHAAMYRGPMPLFAPHAHQLGPTWHNQMPLPRGRGRGGLPPRPDMRNTRSLTPDRLIYADDHRYNMSSLQDNYPSRHYNNNNNHHNPAVDDSKKEHPPHHPTSVPPPTLPHQTESYNYNPQPAANRQLQVQSTSQPAITSHKVDNDVRKVEEPKVSAGNNQSAPTDRLPESPQSNNDDAAKVPASNSLDWVEEIERTERLQARSDLSRSTSATSLHETSPRPKDQGSMRKKREPRRKKRQGGRNEPTERSPSRDSRRDRGGSHESLDHCQWRRGEKENLSWRANSHDRNASGSSRHNSAERWQHRGSRNNSAERWQHRGSRNNSAERWQHRGGGSSRNNSAERWQHRGGGGNTEWFRSGGGGGSGREGREGKDRDRRGRYRNGSRERRGDRRNRRGSSELWSNKGSEETNWRNELRPPEPRPGDTLEQAAGVAAATSNPAPTSQKSPGILVLPPSSSASLNTSSPRAATSKQQQGQQPTEAPPAADDTCFKQPLPPPPIAAHAQRQLFNPNNPNEPIIVASSPGLRGAAPPISSSGPYDTGQYAATHGEVDKCRNVQDQQILSDIGRCEFEIEMILANGHIVHTMEWRYKLLEMQKVLLMTKMNFCQEKNIEQRIWKAVFHNIIEYLRKMMADYPDTTDRCIDQFSFYCILKPFWALNTFYFNRKRVISS
ncbi:uncharacterized protein DDB_G0287625-like [Nilaparvata lugens]|uniref:uncharacterized protein DDB_G0287625-like n=1 Tax=Nilaparvata lugens TaxID=108931 RepID=UPI00193D7257|nr:uncharacterized protein DDB_G0287625-like [Nilaparvata lugens]